MAVVFITTVFIVTTDKLPNRTEAFPTVVVEVDATIFPLKVDVAPWTVRFCWSTVLPVVFESPKLVTNFDISLLILTPKKLELV